MGVIKRQGFKHSIVSYLAVVIGGIATLFIYPLDLESYGKAVALIQFAMVLVPFASFGSVSIVVKFFPFFKENEEDVSAYFVFLIIYQLAFLVIFSSLYLLFFDKLMGFFGKLEWNISTLSEYKYHLLGLIYLVSFANLLVAYSSNLKRIVVPAVLYNIGAKIGMSALILLVALKALSASNIGAGMVIIWTIILLGLVFYLNKLKEMKLKFNPAIYKGKQIKEILAYALFATFGSVGAFLALKIDFVMINLLTNDVNTGIFSIGTFIANVILIPSSAIISISAPIISESIKKNNWSEVRNIYSKSSLNLTIIGVILFALIAVSIENVFSLTASKTDLMSAFNVVLLLGLAKLFDMATSVNGSIVGYSKYFRFNFYALIFLAITNIAFNYWLIPIYGITGAAAATLISLTLFNIAKLLLIWIKFKMMPFTKLHLIPLVLGSLAYLIVSVIPSFGNNLIQIAINSIIIFLLVALPIYLLKVSPDLNSMFINLVNRAKKIF
ncbi:MAG: O-antigen/teichoic acid export membrane protein [Sphingobacteriales bacterium]|jgi:O-antigen/teichoic acid export membrane protein